MTHTGMGRGWWRRTPHRNTAGGPAWRGAAAHSVVAAVLGVGVLHYVPGPPRSLAVTTPTGHARTASALRQIILPDLAVIKPTGVSPAEVGRIARALGVRKVLPLDGASMALRRHRVNVIGVNAQLFRSWTPLSTEPKQRLWNALSAGGFVASPSARHRLRLDPGASYRLIGSATVSLTFAGATPLGIGGVDLVVGARVSARLGLVHHVAALISAPGVGMAKLRREVRAAVGRKAALVTLRAQSPATTRVSATSARRPATYLQLFQESAAMYCPGLPWTVLAAIGQIESGDGANVGPSTAGALGPMQFLPSTWAGWGITAFGEKGPPNVMDPFDAVPSAAGYLCAAGGATAAGLPGAIFAYNHANWYVADVLALAKQYAPGVRLTGAGT